MRRCMIYAVIGLFLLPLYGMAKKRSPKEERTNNHSAFPVSYTHLRAHET